MVIVLGLVVIFGVGQFFAFSNLNSANQASNGQQATQVIYYVPPPMGTSTPVESGICFANSIAEPYRSDAWRCMVGNAISDPCFAIPGSTSTLACAQNPAESVDDAAFMLQLTKALPTAQTAPNTSSSATWGWLVELADGTLCSPFSGTRPFTAGGEVAEYACNGSQPGEDMIFGDLINTSSVWTAMVGSLSTGTKPFPPVIVSSTTVPVAAVWQ